MSFFKKAYVLPQQGEKYRFKGADEPNQMIDHVVIRGTDNEKVYYIKYYKPQFEMYPARDTATFAEFAKFFEKI